MRELLTALACASILSIGNHAHAQTYPSRPITMINPFVAGGPTDIIARVLAERMRAPLGQTVIVENVTGAGGTIGAGRVARAEPDGYTLSIGNWNSHVSAGVIYALAYDPLKDFEPIALLTSAPLWLIAKNALPARDLKELIAWLKANPNVASAATVGTGTAAHVCALYFQNNTGTRFTFVPYRGGAPAYQDVVAGHIDLMCAEVSGSLPYVRSGKAKAYAVMAKTRWAAAPETPTVDEAGVPGVYISFWNALWAPRGTPKQVIARLNSAVVETVADPSVRARLTDIGTQIPPRDQQTPEALGVFHKAEIDKWWPIIKAANIKAE